MTGRYIIYVGFAEKKKAIFAEGKNRFFLFRKSNTTATINSHPGRTFSVFKVQGLIKRKFIFVFRERRFFFQCFCYITF